MVDIRVTIAIDFVELVGIESVVIGVGSFVSLPHFVANLGVATHRLAFLFIIVHVFYG